MLSILDNSSFQKELLSCHLVVGRDWMPNHGTSSDHNNWASFYEMSVIWTTKWYSWVCLAEIYYQIRYWIWAKMKDTGNCMRSFPTVILPLLQPILMALWEFLITDLSRRKITNPGLVSKWFFMICWHPGTQLYHYSSSREIVLESSNRGEILLMSIIESNTFECPRYLDWNMIRNMDLQWFTSTC